MMYPGEGMYSGDFVRLLEKYIHPRFASIGIESNRFGNGPRKEMGLQPMGTIWVAQAAVHYTRSQWVEDHTVEREWLIAMPKGIIPYLTCKNDEWDEVNMKWKSGVNVRGWKPALHELIHTGYLRPDPYLHWLMREWVGPQKVWAIL